MLRQFNSAWYCFSINVMLGLASMISISDSGTPSSRANIFQSRSNSGNRVVALKAIKSLFSECDIKDYHSFRWLNTLRPRQNGRLFADDTFRRIFLNENIRISIQISLKFVPKGLMNNILAVLVLIMAWRRPDDKPLSEPMLVRSLTHICVTRPQ